MDIHEHTYSHRKAWTPRRQTLEVIVHCSATPQGRDHSVDDLQRWHLARGYNAIGYHYVVYRDGTIHRGRPANTVGAHCSGHNSKSVGVCYIGGLSTDGTTPADTRTPAQTRALRELTAWLLDKYPGATLHGHRDFANKACPCFDVSELTTHHTEPTPTT